MGTQTISRSTDGITDELQKLKVSGDFGKVTKVALYKGKR